MRIKRVLLVTAVALGLTAGCSNGGGAANAPQPEKPVLDVAVVPARLTGACSRRRG